MATDSLAARLIIRDCVTGIKFLVDIGADVSTIPVSRHNRIHINDRILYAANGTIIPTYGQKLLQLDLGFRRVFQWPFIIADMDTFITESDFLVFNLLPAIRHKHLIDNTFLKFSAQLVNKANPRLTALMDDCPYKEILSKFPEIMSITHKQTTHRVEHVIKTTSSPCQTKPNDSVQKNLKQLNKRVEYMMQQGLRRSSKSP